MKKLILLIPVFYFSFIQAQQVPEMSQFIINRFYYNPAVAGSNEYTPIRLHIKSQWMNFDKKAPETQWVTAHTRMNEYGIGGSLYNDQSGSFRRIGINFTYSYHLKITNKLNFSAGIGPSVFQFSNDQREYTFFDENDELITGVKEASLLFDANAGIYLYSDNYYAGISGLQLLEPKFKTGNSDADNRLLRNYVFIGGYSFSLSDQIAVEPIIFVKVNSNEFIINPFVQMIYDQKYRIGVGYKNIGAADVFFGIQYKQYHFGYSFEYAMSMLSDYSYGTHEISLGIDLKNKNSSVTMMN